MSAWKSTIYTETYFVATRTTTYRITLKKWLSYMLTPLKSWSSSPGSHTWSLITASSSVGIWTFWNFAKTKPIKGAHTLAHLRGLLIRGGNFTNQQFADDDVIDHSKLFLLQYSKVIDGSLCRSLPQSKDPRIWLPRFKLDPSFEENHWQLFQIGKI